LAPGDDKVESRSLKRNIEKLLAGDELALARMISLAEEDSPLVPRVMKSLYEHIGQAHRIGITGPPGVGKSTLADRLISVIRSDGKTSAILAVDPTSPFTGGAVLGDRVRMQRHFTDKGVYIRSMATRGALGGLTAVINDAADMVDASGKDYILIETVGVGQSELDIFDCADTVAVVLAPDAGDSIQTMKAGLLEIADIFVVNKADLHGADKLLQRLRLMIESSSQHNSWEIPAVACQAENVNGIDAVYDKILAHRRFLEDSGTLAEKRGRQRIRQFERILERRLLQEIRSAISKGNLGNLAEKLRTGDIDPHAAAESALHRARIRFTGEKPQ
jgi:LAO/AO transport system kinase